MNMFFSVLCLEFLVDEFVMPVIETHKQQADGGCQAQFGRNDNDVREPALL